MRAGAVVTVGMLLTLAILCAFSAPATAWEIDQTATVTSIIDGDTFDCSPTGRIRLADIDAPEYYETGYQEATDYLTSLIADKAVYLDIDDVYGTDTYGRWVAVVYVRNNSTHLLNVNQAMLDAGHAVVWDFTNEFDPATWSRYVFYPIDAPPPTATASADVTDGFAPLAVAFTSTASGGLPPYTYLWRFGDGGTSSIPNPSHTFLTGATFSVTMTVTDAALRSSTQTVVITVHSPLRVTASADSTVGIVPVTVTFTATASGGTLPYTYLWVFGDGNTSASPTPSHRYVRAGGYEAVVTVTDSGNRTDTESVQITVAEPSSPPPAGLPGETVGAAAVVAVAAVAVGYVVVRRRRNRSR